MVDTRSQGHERNFELLFDAAKSVLEASRANEASVGRATAALAEARNLMEARLGELQRSVNTGLDSAVERTAREAASLLREKFVAADAIAVEVAERYRGAANTLSKRRWLYFVSAQFAIVLMVGIFAYMLIPPLDEISSRRAEVQRLDAEAARLEKLVSRMQWEKCDVGNGKVRYCVRTDESQFTGAFGKLPDTYRIPKGY
ncbi:hypothetical protein A9975_29290 [Cupriavidus sp. UME77]|nr:hypothetical protein [Cupriavidus sp. UME77]